MTIEYRKISLILFILKIRDLKDTFPKTLSKRRIKKFRKMGEYSQKYKPALKSEIKIWRTALSAGVSTLRNKSK